MNENFDCQIFAKYGVLPQDCGRDRDGRVVLKTFRIQLDRGMTLTLLVANGNFRFRFEYAFRKFGWVNLRNLTQPLALPVFDVIINQCGGVARQKEAA